MQVILTNNVKINCSRSEWIDLEPQLNPYIVVENKAYIQKMNLGISVKDEIKDFALADVTFKNGEVQILLPLGIWDFIKSLFNPLQIRDQRKNQYVNPTSALLKYPMLFGYQKEAVSKMVPHNNGILKAAPGSGKTVMGITLGLLKGKSILWVNDRIDLCKQALKTAVEILNVPEEECGLLQGDNENIKPYTFTTIQKLNKVLNYGFNDVSQNLIHFDTIVIDECHHAVGSYNDYKEYFQALSELDYKHVYGLTAIVKRVDGNEHLVKSLIGPVRHEVTSPTKTMKAKVMNKHCHIETPQEVYDGFINKYTQKAMPAAVDSYLLFHEQFLSFSKPYILQTIKDYNKILIVSPRVAGAQYWSDFLKEEDIDHFLVYGAIKKRERLYTAKVLVATLSLVKEGFDVPDLEAVITIGRLPHKLVQTQIVGRCERYLEGKKSPIAYFLVPHIKKEKKVVWKELNLNDV